MINKSKQKGHIKEVVVGEVGRSKMKVDVEAIIKGICKRRVARCGNLGLMGTTQQFQVMSERNLKRKKKNIIKYRKVLPCYFILTKELQRQACQGVLPSPG